MLDFIKAIYNAIISIFAGETDPEGTEKGDIFAMIKRAFDNLFASLGA